jgi:hypothetical protein
MPTIDVKDAIQKIKIAWNSVIERTIVNCFRKSGFRKSLDDEVVDNGQEEDLSYQVHMQVYY